MNEVIEKLDHIEAANTAKIEEIKSEVNVSLEAVRAEVDEKCFLLCMPIIGKRRAPSARIDRRDLEY